MLILLEWPKEKICGTMYNIVIVITDNIPIEPPIIQYKNHLFSLGSKPGFANEYD